MGDRPKSSGTWYIYSTTSWNVQCAALATNLHHSLPDTQLRRWGGLRWLRMPRYGLSQGWLKTPVSTQQQYHHQSHRQTCSWWWLAVHESPERKGNDAVHVQNAVLKESDINFTRVLSSLPFCIVYTFIWCVTCVKSVRSYQLTARFVILLCTY